MRKIEIEFAIDVELTGDQDTRLYDLIDDIIKSNTPEGKIHWLFGAGYKPLWSEADKRAFPDLKGGDSNKEAGEPDFDRSILYYCTEIKDK